MKTVIVGASKILIALLVIMMLVAGLLLWFVTFGVRPYDRINGKIKAAMKTDPDKAYAMYPQLFEALDKNKMSVEDKGTTYANYGYFLVNHGRLKEAIEALQKAEEYSANDYKGITKANAIVAIADCQLVLDNEYKPTQADLAVLLQATAVHAPRESSDDKWFWPLYEKILGRMYGRMGDLDKAIPILEKAADEYHQIERPWSACECRGEIIEALVRNGKYAEANKKFVAYMKALPDGDYTHRLARVFRDCLAQAQDKDPGFGARVQTLLRAKKFSELDRLANDKQASKAVLANGRLPVDDLYEALGSMENRKFDQDWLARKVLLEEWVSASPQSVTAKIALATLLTDYAWRARGSDYADSVTNEGWKLFEDRLNQAMTVLNQIKDKPPDWYSCAQRCALGQNWPNERYNAMVAECRKRYPSYPLVVFKKCHYLLPRWNGQPGDLESYLSAEANKVNGTAGNIMYGQAAWYLDVWVGNVMSETSLSWPRVKAGMLADIKAHPESLVARGELSIMAMQAKDEKTALDAFSGKSK